MAITTGKTTTQSPGGRGMGSSGSMAMAAAAAQARAAERAAAEKAAAERAAAAKAAADAAAAQRAQQAQAQVQARTDVYGSIRPAPVAPAQPVAPAPRFAGGAIKAETQYDPGTRAADIGKVWSNSGIYGVTDPAKRTKLERDTLGMSMDNDGRLTADINTKLNAGKSKVDPATAGVGMHWTGGNEPVSKISGKGYAVTIDQTGKINLARGFNPDGTINSTSHIYGRDPVTGKPYNAETIGISSQGIEPNAAQLAAAAALGENWFNPNARVTTHGYEAGTLVEQGKRKLGKDLKRDNVRQSREGTALAQAFTGQPITKVTNWNPATLNRTQVAALQPVVSPATAQPRQPSTPLSQKIINAIPNPSDIGELISKGLKKGQKAVTRAVTPDPRVEPPSLGYGVPAEGVSPDMAYAQDAGIIGVRDLLASLENPTPTPPHVGVGRIAGDPRVSYTPIGTGFPANAFRESQNMAEAVGDMGGSYMMGGPDAPTSTAALKGDRTTAPAPVSTASAKVDLPTASRLAQALGITGFGRVMPQSPTSQPPAAPRAMPSVDQMLAGMDPLSNLFDKGDLLTGGTPDAPAPTATAGLKTDLPQAPNADYGNLLAALGVGQNGLVGVDVNNVPSGASMVYGAQDTTDMPVADALGLTMPRNTTVALQTGPNQVEINGAPEAVPELTGIAYDPVQNIMAQTTPRDPIVGTGVTRSLPSRPGQEQQVAEGVPSQEEAPGIAPSQIGAAPSQDASSPDSLDEAYTRFKYEKDKFKNLPKDFAKTLVSVITGKYDGLVGRHTSADNPDPWGKTRDTMTPEQQQATAAYLLASLGYDPLAVMAMPSASNSAQQLATLNSVFI